MLPIPLKDDVAVLTELIAYGGFGKVWMARMVNVVALLGEIIKAVKEDAALLGIAGVPYNRLVEEGGIGAMRKELSRHGIA